MVSTEYTVHRNRVRCWLSSARPNGTECCLECYDQLNQTTFLHTLPLRKLESMRIGQAVEGRLPTQDRTQDDPKPTDLVTCVNLSFLDLSPCYRDIELSFPRFIGLNANLLFVFFLNHCDRPPSASSLTAERPFSS